ACIQTHLHDLSSPSSSRPDLFRNLQCFTSIMTIIMRPTSCPIPQRNVIDQLLLTSSCASLIRLELSGIGTARLLACHQVAEMPHLRSGDLRLLESCLHFVSFRAMRRAIHAHDMRGRVSYATRGTRGRAALGERGYVRRAVARVQVLVHNHAPSPGCVSVWTVSRIEASGRMLVEPGAAAQLRSRAVVGSLVKLQEFSWRFGLCNGPEKEARVDVGASGAQVTEDPNRGEKRLEPQGGGEVIEWGWGHHMVK
ncbi:hypothetical protein BGZ81_004420, partial [Podila clonocystis]